MRDGIKCAGPALAGGPGGTQMAAVRHELAELEKHFVVVNWISRAPASLTTLKRYKTSPLTHTFKTVTP